MQLYLTLQLDDAGLEGCTVVWRLLTGSLQSPNVDTAAAKTLQLRLHHLDVGEEETSSIERDKQQMRWKLKQVQSVAEVLLTCCCRISCCRLSAEGIAFQKAKCGFKTKPLQHDSSITRGVQILYFHYRNDTDISALNVSRYQSDIVTPLITVNTYLAILSVVASSDEVQYNPIFDFCGQYKSELGQAEP